jgi:serine/threonine protein kinase
MRYCINPNCKHRDNPDQTFCQTCHTPLVLEGRFEVLNKISNAPTDHPWEVFRVRDMESLNTSQEYRVLKTLKKHSDIHQKLFTYEKESLSKLQNPGIPEYVMDFPIPAEDSRPKLDCLIMELFEGQDLARWLENHKLESDDRKKTIKWLQKIVMILDYIHSENCFHRDIKPSNIILRDNENLALIDFGIAREITSTVAVQGAETEVSTPVYAAPEQLVDNPRAYPHSDFFALGKTFVHLLTGCEPKKGIIAREDWQSRTELRETGIIPLIDWLLTEDYRQRPQTAGEILKVLRYIEQLKMDGSHRDDAETEKFINGIRKKPNPRKIWISIAILTIISCFIGFFSTEYIRDIIKKNSVRTPSPAPLAPEELISFGDRKIEQSDLQRGDKLIPKEKDLELINKGIEHFQKEEYLDAYTIFYNLRQSAEQEKSLPIGDRKHEAVRKYANLLIYMNNAKVRYWHKIKNPKSTIHTIISAIPADFVRGQQILYGIAHAQSIATLPADSVRIKTFYSNSVSQNKTIDVSLDKNNIDKEPKEYLEIGIANDLSDRETVIALSKKIGEEYITGLDKQKRSVLAVIV